MPTSPTGLSRDDPLATSPVALQVPAALEPRPGGVRSAVKLASRGLAMALVALPVLAYRVMARLAGGRADEVYQGFSQLMSLWPGVLGDYLRNAFYGLTLTRCPVDSRIAFGTIFATPEVVLANRVYVGANGNIGHVTIGEDTLLGSNVTVLSGKRQHHFDRLDVPIQRQGGTYTRVTIGRDAWIGNGAILMADVGDQAIVAAGAVVTKPVPARAIVAGNPARVVGMRGERGRDADGT